MGGGGDIDVGELNICVNTKRKPFGVNSNSISGYLDL